MEKALYPDLSILIVDDEKIMLESFKRVLNYAGITNIILCDDSRKVMDLLKANHMELILLDLIMPFITGEELLSKIAEEYPEIPIVIITGVREVETAVKCMRSSAFDYLIKPVDEDSLISAVERAIRFREMQTEIVLLKKSIFKDELSNPEFFENIITQNKKMKAIFQYVEAIAVSSQPVLISGETGTGKEMIAETVHKCSKREGKYIKVSIAGLDDTMFSDTLFGHTKGAFTGADGNREGLVKKAKNGTLFLDEIGDLNENSQLKLLRLLQEKEYLPLGSDEPQHTNTRVLAATNKDLEECTRQGKFRKDLFYRLKTHHIHIPPLREKMDDLSLLVDYFLSLATNELKIDGHNLKQKLIRKYSKYSFPGNIRELKAMVYDDVAMYKADNHQHLIPEGTKQNEYELNIMDFLENLDELPSLKQATIRLIKEALKRTNGNKTLAAKLLGITRQTIINYLGDE